MAYEKVEAKTWKPVNPNDFIEGKLKRIESNVGGNNSMLYHIDKGNEVEGVWGSAVLDPLMNEAREGDQIKIIYTGLGTAKPGKNAPKIYELQIDKSLRKDPASLAQEAETQRLMAQANQNLATDPTGQTAAPNNPLVAQTFQA